LLRQRGRALARDPHARSGPGAEREQRKVRDVSGREDVALPFHASVLVDDDPVVDDEAGRNGQCSRRLDANAGNDKICLERATGTKRDGVPVRKP